MCCAFLAALLMLAVLALPGMAVAPLVRDEMGLFDADTYNELEQSAEAAPAATIATSISLWSTTSAMPTSGILPRIIM